MLEALIGLPIYAVIMGIVSKVKRANRIKQIEVECAARAELFRNVTASMREKEVSEEQRRDYEERKEEVLVGTDYENDNEGSNNDIAGMYDNNMKWPYADDDDDEEDVKWLFDDDDVDMKWVNGDDDDDDEMNELHRDAGLFGDTDDGMSDSSTNKTFLDVADKEVGLHVGMDIITDDWDLW